MMATNHMLVGAAVAVGIRQPLLVVPVAMATHFILDLLPHFGILESDTPERNSHPLFRVVLVLDIVLAIVGLVLFPFILSGVISWWIVLLGMLAAWLPDVVWVSHFIHDKRGHIRKEPIKLTQFHQKIQWFEKPVGLIIEIIWMGGMSTYLFLVAR
jgi:hypothetical protein